MTKIGSPIQTPIKKKPTYTIWKPTSLQIIEKNLLLWKVQVSKDKAFELQNEYTKLLTWSNSTYQQTISKHYIDNDTKRSKQLKVLPLLENKKLYSDVTKNAINK